MEKVLDEPDESCLGSVGWVKYEENSQGLTLCRYFWPAVGKPKGVVLAVHGHGVHTQFEFCHHEETHLPAVYKNSWVERYNNEGFSVCSLDNQSHGRSEGVRGLRCYAESFQHFVDDVLHFARWVKEASSASAPGFADLPIFILGVSLGGCIATNAIHQQGELFKGAVLLAPMLSLEKISKSGLNPYLRPLVGFISAAFPTLPVAQAQVNEMFPSVQEAFEKDPGNWRKMTRARLANEYLKATENTCKLFPDMKFPFIVFHSTKDDMTDPVGSQKLYECSQAEDKTLKMVDDMWHFLIQEPGNEKMLEMTIEWLLART